MAEQARLAVLWRFFVASALLVLLLVFSYFGDASVSGKRLPALIGFVGIEYASILAGLVLRYVWRSNLLAVQRLMAVELLLDLSGLSILIYFSGGLFSEFLALFVFVAIAAVGLLQPPIRYVLVVCAVLMLPMMGVLNWLGYGHELPALPSPDMALTVFVRSFYYIGVIGLGSGFAVYLARYAERAQIDLAATALGLQQMRRYNEQILAAIPSGLVLTNPVDNTILGSNLAARQILGDSFASSIALMLHEPRTTTSRGEVETADNQILGFSITDINLPNTPAGRSANLLMFQDVTQYRRLEKQVETQDKLTAIGRLGANLAHEIRNPLTSISNVIQLLQEKDTGNAANQTLLNLAGSEIQRLERLLTEFLAFAKPSDQPILANLESFNPHNELANILNHLNRPPNAEYKLESTEPDRLITGNRHVFQQIAYNLVLNASQWASPEAPVIICRLQILDSTLQLTVEDNGPGISPENQKTIWEPFMSTRPNGTGLGLALVSNLSTSLGGSIAYDDSKLLGGAKFVFFMPVRT